MFGGWEAFAFHRQDKDSGQSFVQDEDVRTDLLIEGFDQPSKESFLSRCRLVCVCWGPSIGMPWVVGVGSLGGDTWLGESTIGWYLIEWKQILQCDKLGRVKTLRVPL